MKLTQDMIDNPTNEKQVQAAVVKCLRDNGWLVIRNQQNIGSHKGVADLVCLRQGVTVWIECKGPKGNLRPDQISFMQSITQNGGNYICVRHVADIPVHMRIIA